MQYEQTRGAYQDISSWIHTSGLFAGRRRKRRKFNVDESNPVDRTQEIT